MAHDFISDNDCWQGKEWYYYFLLCFFCNISEPTPQTSKASSATMETDPSIDEILGLQVLKKTINTSIIKA